MLPVLRATKPRDLFADPFADTDAADDLRSVLVVLDDGSDEMPVREQRSRLEEAAHEHDVRVETVAAQEGDEVARYAALLATGTWAAAYLKIGLGRA